jgi:hypothetical protein
MKIFTIIADIFWLVIRFFKRKDANEPQRTLDQARQDSATGNDDALNRDLDNARDRRLQNGSPRNRQ